MPKQSIIIKYVYPENYVNYEKYISFLGNNKMGLNRELLNDDIINEVMYKLLIFGLANTNEMSFYNQLVKNEKLSHRHNDLKDFIRISPFARIFGIENKDGYMNNDDNERIETVLKNPKMILTLGWEYIFREEEEFDNLDKISDTKWLAFSKALDAISENKKKIDLSKDEKDEIGLGIFMDMIKAPSKLYLALLDSATCPPKETAKNGATLSDEEKKSIHERIKALINKSGEIEKIKVRDIVKGEYIQISKYLLTIIGGLARHKKLMPMLTNINTRISTVDYEKRTNLELDEEKKDLAYIRQEKAVNDELDNMFNEGFVSKFYIFGERMLKHIDIRGKEFDGNKLHNDRFKDRFLNYYLLEQMFAFELFEHEIRCIKDRLLSINEGKEEKNEKEMEEEFLAKAHELGAILSYIYTFPYVFMRKKIAETMIEDYMETDGEINPREWYKIAKKDIKKKQKRISQLEKNFITGLFYKKITLWMIYGTC